MKKVTAVKVEAPVATSTPSATVSSTSGSAVVVTTREENPRSETDEEAGMSDDSIDTQDTLDESEEMDITSQLASAGPTGMAAAAAISSTKKRKRSLSFETNPSIRKRQQTRLLRKLRQNIEEYSLRVGQQAVVIVATPGKAQNSNFKAFGAKPLEDVIRNLRSVITTELETALANQAPPTMVEDPNRHELPPLVIDGLPTPVEKMTQAQLRAFIPLMLKYSTGRGKPGWGKDNTRPPWWPAGVPWANVRMDARSESEKQRVSWTHALREIVTNCYKYHHREDLMPAFEEEEANKKATTTTLSAANVQQLISAAQSHQMGQTVVQTIANPDGTVSIVQVENSNPIIQLPDGTTAQIQGFTQVEGQHQGIGTLAEVATSEAGQHYIQIAGDASELAHEGHIILATGEDGQAFPVTLNGGVITVPVPNSVYQQVIQSGEGVQLVSATSVQVPKAESQAEATTTSTAPIVAVSAPSTAAASPAPVAKKSATRRGLTITPVATSSGPTQVVNENAVSSTSKKTVTRSVAAAAAKTGTSK